MSQAVEYLVLGRSLPDEDLRTLFETLEGLYRKKLWHQLTLALQQGITHRYFLEGSNMIDLYDKFIKDFEHKINQLALVNLIVIVNATVSQEKAISLLEDTHKKVKTHTEASILCRTHLARLRVETEGLEPLKRMVEDLNTEVDALDHVTSTHGEFYKLSSHYYRRLGNHAQFYRDTLRFLGCTDYEQMPLAERTEVAFAVGVAALLGDGIYNFGELLEHHIVKALEGTDREWLYVLLQQANAGSLAHLDKATEWRGQQDLAAAEQQLRAKISLLALMEMVFAHPASERTISFDDIAKRVDVPLNDVEMLVMRALSLGLVKGSLDEVSHCFASLHRFCNSALLFRLQCGILILWTIA